MAQSTFRPTFYLTINSLFILLILCVSAILTWHNYRSTKKIVFRAADIVYDQVAREVTQDFIYTYKPVFQMVHFLSLDQVMNASTFEERIASLEVISVALRNMKEVSGIGVGYDNGDYFIMRPAPDERVRTLLEGPEKCAFVIDHISVNEVTNKRELLRLFYDSSLVEISKQEPVESEYDPRVRPWYKEAISSQQPTGVVPYLFEFLREIGTTVVYRPPGISAVIAADVTIDQISGTLTKHLLTPGSEIVLIGADGRVLAYNKPERIIVPKSGDSVEMAFVSQLGSEIMSFMDQSGLLKPGPLDFEYNGEQWLGDARTLNVSGIEGRDLTLVMVSPVDELLANVIAMVKRSLLITACIILLSLPIVTLVAAVISRKLSILAREANLISRFDFTKPLTLRSKIKEVDELALSMGFMKDTISRFLMLVKSLADEQNFDAMLEQITTETMSVSKAGGVLTCLINDDAKTLTPGVLYEQSVGQVDVRGLPTVPLDSDSEFIQAIEKKDISHIELNRDKHEGMQELLDMFVVDKLLVTALPLQNRSGEAIGLLCLLNKSIQDGRDIEAQQERMDFVRTFSGFAAVSLESRQLFEMQKRLMDSFMHLLAGAIDAKSPYTGGHCQRVPVITKMIARAACDDEGQFKEYKLDEEGWEAVHLAGWLHDCGKVTTPEYVVDKSTKLETIYDRIHEIRTRFEVLKRDAHIRYWEQVADGGDRAELKAALEKEWKELDEDFAFIAECNLGGEFMAPEKIERLDKIAERKWVRTLDDRIGISWEEEKRKAKTAKQDLPVEEFVLADRQDHLIERNVNERMPEDNTWGFKLDVPEYRYNLGELYNLKVARGTLTAEERYKINDHIVQTIIMLEKLPYPKHLREVPELAGGHHETMDGNGYPKRLTSDQMSLTARMMAIADIFEALTASDRPYKKAKKLSETIKIMSFMKKDHHIDPDLFRLFLTSGVYREYAEKYLEPSQIDDVNIEEYLDV